MNDFIYIISSQSGAGSAGIYSIWTTYNLAINAYYQCIVVDNNHSFNLDCIFLYKMPVNEKFCENDTWSDIKIQKSSKYRIKFKDFRELDKIYTQVIRTIKIDLTLLLTYDILGKQRGVKK